ncbi:MAG: hypothetical protein H5U37_07890 [Caldisericia bacterium]|nr:hypothetical protein [Caldisericia bacterium]
MGKDEFVYTDYEVEIILKEIEKLTENELCKKNLELTKLIKKLDEILIRDELTGLFNRRKIGEK